MLSCCHDDIYQQHQENHEDADHLCGIFLRLNPELTEEVESAEHLYRHPEHHYCSYSHTYVGTPRRQAQLLFEDEYAAKQTACRYYAGDGMAVAKEVAVVSEHQQQIACPENHVQLHKRH